MRKSFLYMIHGGGYRDGSAVDFRLGSYLYAVPAGPNSLTPEGLNVAVAMEKLLCKNFLARPEEVCLSLVSGWMRSPGKTVEVYTGQHKKLSLKFPKAAIRTYQSRQGRKKCL